MNVHKNLSWELFNDTDNPKQIRHFDNLFYPIPDIDRFKLSITSMNIPSSLIQTFSVKEDDKTKYWIKQKYQKSGSDNVHEITTYLDFSKPIFNHKQIIHLINKSLQASWEYNAYQDFNLAIRKASPVTTLNTETLISTITITDSDTVLPYTRGLKVKLTRIHDGKPDQFKKLYLTRKSDGKTILLWSGGPNMNDHTLGDLLNKDITEASLHTLDDQKNNIYPQESLLQFSDGPLNGSWDLTIVCPEATPLSIQWELTCCPCSETEPYSCMSLAYNQDDKNLLEFIFDRPNIDNVAYFFSPYLRSLLDFHDNFHGDKFIYPNRFLLDSDRTHQLITLTQQNSTLYKFMNISKILVVSNTLMTVGDESLENSNFENHLNSRWPSSR